MTGNTVGLSRGGCSSQGVCVFLGCPCSHQRTHGKGLDFGKRRSSPRRKHKLLEFTGVLPFVFAGKVQVDEHSALTRIGSIKEQYYLGDL